jgi:hypothetical protein
MFENIETAITTVKASEIDLEKEAAAIKHELDGVENCGRFDVSRAIAVGHHLLKVKPYIKRGFRRWLEKHGLKKTDCYDYMLLAKNEESVRSSGHSSVAAALRMLRVKSGRGSSSSKAKKPNETLAQHWKREKESVRAAFLDQIGVQGFLEAISPAFRQELCDRMPAKTKPAASKARSKSPERTNVHLDRGAFARGMGLAGPPDNKFRTITMPQNGVDADGNPNYGQPPAHRSRVN